jgi:hypothetical protein
MLWNEIRLTTCSTFRSLILTIVPLDITLGQMHHLECFTCKSIAFSSKFYFNPGIAKLCLMYEDAKAQLGVKQIAVCERQDVW